MPDSNWRADVRYPAPSPDAHIAALTDRVKELEAVKLDLTTECASLNGDAERISIERDELRTRLDQVDDVLTVNWIAHDGTDYRKSLNDLITWNIQIHDDPTVSEVAKARADRQKRTDAVVEAARAMVKEGLSSDDSYYRFRGLLNSLQQLEAK